MTARSDVGRRLDELYPYHRVPLVLEELDLDRHADVDAAVVAYPHGAAAPLVKRAARRGACKVVDLSADFRLRDPAVVRASGTASTRRRSCSSEAVYGLPELYRERDPRRRRWSPTRAATRPRRCWRSRRWRARG